MIATLVTIALASYGVFFTAVAAMKLTRHGHMTKEFARMGLPYGLASLSAAVEIVCGPGLILGIWFPAVAGVAAMILVPTMIGAAIANLVTRPIQFAVGLVVVFLVPISLLAQYHEADVRELLGG